MKSASDEGSWGAPGFWAMSVLSTASIATRASSTEASALSRRRAEAEAMQISLDITSAPPNSLPPLQLLGLVSFERRIMKYLSRSCWVEAERHIGAGRARDSAKWDLRAFISFPWDAPWPTQGPRRR